MGSEGCRPRCSRWLTPCAVIRPPALDHTTTPAKIQTVPAPSDPTPARFRIVRIKRTILLPLSLCAVLLSSACGDGNGRALVFDSVPPTTTTTIGLTTDPLVTPSTEAALPQVGPWVDVTANLAGMQSECGNMSYVGANPGKDQVIAGIALQGLWSNDAATGQWAKLGAGGADIKNRAASIVFDPDAPDNFWESGHYSGPGAVHTTNGGQTFQALGSIGHLDGLSVDFSDPQRGTLLAGSHERADLYRSTDGGASWANLAANLPSDIGYASQPLVLDAKTFLLGTYVSGGGGNPGIFRSTDSGATWQQVSKGGVAGPPLVASDGSIYWPLQSGNGLLKSSDEGATWQVASGGGVLASYNLIELPDGRLASVGRTHLVVSDDAGATWRALGPALPTDGAFGLTYSAARHSIYIWHWDCGDKVVSGSVQRLDVTPLGD